MPVPPQSRLNVMRAPRAEYSQADTAENYRELERWANERAPIFPVYEYRAQAVTGGALGSAVPVEYPTGTEVSLQVQKKFDWTVLVCSLNITCYVTATGRLDFYSTLDDDYPGSDFLTLLYFNNTGYHRVVSGHSSRMVAKAGSHKVSLYITAVGGASATMDTNDMVQFTVQEQPPRLASGESWV